MRIDAHQHFWDPARSAYPWMAGEAMDPVRRAFTPDDLRGVLRDEDIDGTVLVQTISSLAETREFLQLAAATDFIAGVVGWVDLTSPAVGDDLDELLGGPGGGRLVGIRHQVHDEADPEWLRRDDVLRGLLRGLAASCTAGTPSGHTDWIAQVRPDDSRRRSRPRWTAAERSVAPSLA